MGETVEAGAGGRRGGGWCLQALALPPAPPPGIMVQGAGSSDWLQVSSDGLHWHSLSTSGLAFSLHPRYCPLGPWTSDPPCPFLCGAHSLCSQGVSCFWKDISYFRGLFKYLLVAVDSDLGQKGCSQKGHDQVAQMGAAVGSPTAEGQEGVGVTASSVRAFGACGEQLGTALPSWG